MPKFTIGLGDINLEKQVATTTVQVVDAPTNGLLGLSSAAAGYGPVVKVGVAQIDPQMIKESEPSKATFHSTLFETFRLKAEPTYNFYVKDETTSFVADVSESLDRLPRYVTLTWRTAPRRSVVMQSEKGTKPFLTTPLPPRPVVPFDIVSTAAANGYVKPGVLTTTITAPPPPPTGPQFDEDAFLLSDEAAGDLAALHVASDDSPFATVTPTQVQSLKVSFVDPSIAGALDTNRLSVATQDVHLTVAGSFSKIVGGLEIISEFNQDVPSKNPAPSFPAPADAPVVTYIGYIIERHDVSPDGSMRLGRTIRVENIDTGYYVDRQVVYGMTYAYRIRSIVQWVHPTNVGFDGRSTVDRIARLDETVGTKVASYYYGDWSDWTRTEVLDLVPPDPPDELIVMPNSRKGHIRVCWKMPNDPQRDVTTLHLLRATVRAGRSTDWVELGTFRPGNGAHNDRDVVPYEQGSEEYIYAMYSTSVHGQVSTLGEQVLARLVSPRASHEHPLVRTAPIGSDPTTHPVLGDSRESTEVVATRRVVMYCRGGTSGHPLRDRDYLLDVRSLSTGERVQVSLNADSTEILSKDA